MQSEAEKKQPATKQKKPAQPTLPLLFEKQRKYDAKSPEAVRLNKAVAEFLCVDQIPIYTVEKPGFQQLLRQLNPRYDLPSRNHFMYSEIPKLYDTARQTLLQQLQGKPYFACTTDLWTSTAAELHPLSWL